MRSAAAAPAARFGTATRFTNGACFAVLVALHAFASGATSRSPSEPPASNEPRRYELPFPASDITRVVMLGTGTPNADPDRSGPALAIVVRGVPYLVDCGPGVVRRAAAAQASGIQGLTVSRLSRVFITHLHSDHTAGLPDLWLTPWVLDRRVPLEVWGPKGVARMASHLRDAYKEDIEVRLKGGQPHNPNGWKLVAHEVRPGVVYRDSNLTVTAFAVRHGTWKHAFGFRFDTPDRRIVVSGDCAPSPA